MTARLERGEALRQQRGQGRVGVVRTSAGAEICVQIQNFSKYMPSEPDAASEPVAEAEIEAGRYAHSRVDIEKLITEHVQKGGVVTIDTDGVITFKPNKKGYIKELSYDEAMVEARRGDGRGIKVTPTRTESAKKRRDRARNTHANYVARQEKRQKERQQQQTREAATIATEVTEAMVTFVEKAAVEAINETGTAVAPERAAKYAGPGKRLVVESQESKKARASKCATASKEKKTDDSSMAIEAARPNAYAPTAKRGLEITAALGKAKRQDVSSRPTASKTRTAARTAAPLAGKATAVNKTTEHMYKSKGITRMDKSKGETTSYASAAYKALTRGERMLIATRG